MIKKVFGPLFGLRGNARYAIFTEPLWGIPFNLYNPFMMLFMFSLGITDDNIGIIMGLGMVVQMIASVLSGILTDKFGRRKTNIIWDHLAWSVPCLIWAFAQDFRWFVVAALFNGLWPVGSNAWECLLVEDEEPDKIVQLFNWIYIAGSVSVFFAPLSIVFIPIFGLVPFMRVLLVISAFSMSAKFTIHFIFATETEQGKTRLAETKDVRIWKMLLEYGGVIREIFTTPVTRRILVMMVLVSFMFTTSGYFTLYATEDLGLPEAYAGWIPVLRGAIMLIFFLALQRILNKFNLYKVMIVGLMFYMAAFSILLSAPVGALVPIGLFVLIDACAVAMFMPRRDSLLMNCINPDDRARIRAIIMAITLAITAPFAAWVGHLSDIDRRIPFRMSLVLFALIGVCVVVEMMKAKVEGIKTDEKK